MTDAIVAMDLQTGRVRCASQRTANDSWTAGCSARNPDKPACPPVLGPDYDFSASPSLTTVAGRDLLIVPQKSGLMFALDPDNEGALVWTQRIGHKAVPSVDRGAPAIDYRTAYVGVSDILTSNPGELRVARSA
jgi:polyvinyl alcohol dehydrogenase (cytochrome)